MPFSFSGQRFVILWLVFTIRIIIIKCLAYTLCRPLLNRGEQVASRSAPWTALERCSESRKCELLPNHGGKRVEAVYPLPSNLYREFSGSLLQLSRSHCHEEHPDVAEPVHMLCAVDMLCGALSWFRFPRVLFTFCRGSALVVVGLEESLAFDQYLPSIDMIAVTAQRRESCSSKLPLTGVLCFVLYPLVDLPGNTGGRYDGQRR